MESRFARWRIRCVRTRRPKKARDRRRASEGAPCQDRGAGGSQLFFGTKAQALGREVRRGMIEPDHPRLSVVQQCKLLSISRSSFYYTPKGETAQNLDLMRRIDEQFLETPFFGVRQMTWHLRNDGHLVNEKRIWRLMRLMGLMPIYQNPNTSRPAKGHKIYPYLLKGLKVERPYQVWCSDITYLPM